LVLDLLISSEVRIIFRMAEFAGGISPNKNPIPFHEAYTYALDCFPIMSALLILAIWHPGRYLVGPESEFYKLSRREKKERKREKKEAQQQEKEARNQTTEDRKRRRRSSRRRDDGLV
jgi:hypothetical protein